MLGRCLDCGVTVPHNAGSRAFRCADCADEAAAEAADPVLLASLRAMGFAERAALRALMHTGNRNLDAAIEWIAATQVVSPDEVAAPAQAPTGIQASLAALGEDGLAGILLRLVASGSAAQLSRCSLVNRLWYAEAVRDELWLVLLRRRWGDAAEVPRSGGAQRPVHAQEAALSNRALYIRSVTTQVLTWGQGAVREDELGTAPRTPELLGIAGLIGVGVRQISAGLCFTAAVTWAGGVLCWGANGQGQCGQDSASEVFVQKLAARTCVYKACLCVGPIAVHTDTCGRHPHVYACTHPHRCLCQSPGRSTSGGSWPWRLRAGRCHTYIYMYCSHASHTLMLFIFPREKRGRDCVRVGRHTGFVAQRWGAKGWGV